MKMITRRGVFLWVLCALFIIGAAFLTYSLVTDGSVWVMKTYNSHVYSNSQLIAAGSITDRDGTVLSETVDGERVYNSDSGIRLSTLHAVGDKKGFISTGVQSIFESELVGYSLWDGVYKITKNGSGNDIELTIDAEINEIALEALGDYKGTIAVVNYLTGDIVCMVSTPTYDVNNIPSDIDSSDEYEGAYMNRFLTGLYTPGSTFKLVTAICALENLGSDVLESSYTCTGTLDVDGIEEDEIVCNATHGTLTFKQALAKSCNSAFAQIAIELGAEKLIDTAESLGFTSSVTVSDRITSAQSRFYLEKSDADTLVGWTGVGQGDTLVTPAAMLRLMCAIANDGKAVSFNLVNSLTDKAGESLGITFSSNETQLISSETASTMKELMRNNVTSQYGDSNYKGLSLCAKSGTAQIDDDESHNTAWFVGFMDDSEHPYAFVVVVECGNSGSQTAGPMANKVLQAVVADD
ncbi:MAG: penicillin-binding protein [Clostridiales bacterium]|nr:penicillin-binding protein [Clostridiales bacterium]